MLASTSSRVVSRMITKRAAAVSVGAPLQARSYHENIVEHYENPRNVGSLDKADDSVGTVRIHNRHALNLMNSPWGSQASRESVMRTG